MNMVRTFVCMITGRDANAELRARVEEKRAMVRTIEHHRLRDAIAKAEKAMRH